MFYALIFFISSLVVPFSANAKQSTQEDRLDLIERRGIQVMPFSLDLTTHVFTKTENGGIQQVVVKDEKNFEQIRLIREHLSKIAKEFSQRDFSGPENIHGKDMPGLAELRNARTSELSVHYAELPNGARIDYSSDKPQVVEAVHQWFDAQLSDHARHAVSGHDHHRMHDGHRGQERHEP